MNPKILIGTIYDNESYKGPSYSQIAKITSKSLIEYCNLYGYDYRIDSEKIDKARPISWSKVCMAQQELENTQSFGFFDWQPKYDWVWITDIDLYIVNHQIKLEDILDENYDVLMTCYSNDINHLNTGSIIYKNTEWTRNLLKEIYDSSKYPIEGQWVFFEQTALMNYYKSHPEEQKHFKMIDTRTINSHYQKGMDFLNVNYKEKDFVVHLAGTNNEYRLNTLTEFEKYRLNPENGFNIKIWE